MTCTQIIKRPAFANMGEAMDWEIRHGQTPYELPIVLPEQAWRDLADSMSELTHIVRMAKATLNHLHDFISQSLDGDFGLISLLELASRGLEHASEHECALVDDVEVTVRAAVSQMIKEKVARDREEKAA